MTADRHAEPIEPHPDADLLAALDSFIELKDKRNDLFSRAHRGRQRAAERNQLLEDAFAGTAIENDLERRICRTRATTLLGVIAKLQLALATLSPAGRDGLESSHAVFIHATSISAIRDALAFLDGLGDAGAPMDGEA